jgi:hypothetical protein
MHRSLIFPLKDRELNPYVLAVVLYKFVMGRTVARTGKLWNWYKILIAKCQENRPLGRDTHRWEDNIKIYLGEIA